MTEEIAPIVDTAQPATAETFHGDHGAREAAAEIAEKRRTEDAETELSLREAREAVAEVAQRREAEKKGVELVEATKRHQENLARPNLTVVEASELLLTERGIARAQAEADLQEILGERREAEAQPQQQPQPQPVDNEAQAKLSAHVQAQRLQAADSHACRVISQLSMAGHQIMAQARAEFADVVAAPTDQEKQAVIANMTPARKARYQALDVQFRELEGNARAWQAERVKYAEISSGAAQRAQRAQYDAWAKAEDQKAIAAIPELSGPNAKAFQDAAVKVLEACGIPKEQMANILDDRAYRSSAAQQVIAAATRAYLAKEGLEAKKAKPKPVPKVQKPGSSYGFRSGGGDVANLSRELSSSKGDKQVRLAAQLLAARRNARGA